MRELFCEICKKPLANGLDTYGEVGQEMCWNCYSSFMPGAGPNNNDWQIVTPGKYLAGITRIEIMPGQVTFVFEYDGADGRDVGDDLRALVSRQ